MSLRKEEIDKLAGVDFFGLAKNEPHPRVRIRLLALGHLQEGKSKTEIAEMFQVHLVSVRAWFVRFLENGIAGLNEGARSGRRKKLLSEKEEEFCKEIELLQQNKPGGRIRGQDIQLLLKEKFCAEYKLKSVYDVLERCNISWISARSKHPQMDPEIQEDFKKNSKKK